MSDSQPYAKITVIVEEADGTTTVLTIPKAMDIKLERKSVPNEDPFSDWSTLPYFLSEMDFTIDFKGLYDHAAGFIFQARKTQPPEEYKHG
jgi:hypothetical protein